MRELQNAIEYAFVKCRSVFISLPHLPAEVVAGSSCEIRMPGSQLPKHRHRARQHVTRKRTEQALQAAGWNITKAAKLLKVSRTILYKRIDEFGLEEPLV